MSNLLKSKFFLGALVVTVMFVGAFAVNANKASADCTITMTLKVGSKGTEVSCLQTKVGATSDGNFGPMTKTAVMAWQAGHGLSADGVVGPMTRAALNGTVAGGFPAGCTSATGYSTTTGLPCNTGGTLPAGCTSTAGYSPTTGASCSGGGTPTTGGPLTGGAGSLDDVQEVASLSDEEVAEGSSDTKVAGWTVTADAGSDLAITAMKLSFDLTAGSGSDQFDDYADKVTIWQGSTEVGSANVSSFSENSNVYSKTINLTGAVVRADQDSDFFVTIDAVGNVDSSDLGNNTWTLTLESVRLQDATGAILTDSSTGDIAGTVTFSFESVATSTGTELKVSKTTGSSGDEINDGHVVDVDDTSDTNDVSLLAFDLKATGDIQNIQDIPVKLVSTGTGEVVDQASGFSLWMDGTQIDSVNAGDVQETSVSTTGNPCDAGADTTCWVHFDDIDFDLDDGDTAHFVVKADVRDTEAALLVDGDTLTASITGTEVDAIDAEDANGDSVDTADLTGTAIAEAIAFYDKGIIVSLSGTPTATLSDNGTAADSGTFAITFNVTAFGSDAYVDKSAPDEAGGSGESDYVMSNLNGTPSAVISSPSGATEGTNGFLIEEGNTEKFTVSVGLVAATAAGYWKASLESIAYALTDVDATTYYNFNLDDFKTSDLFMNI